MNSKIQSKTKLKQNDEKCERKREAEEDEEEEGVWECVRVCAGSVRPDLLSRGRYRGQLSFLHWQAKTERGKTRSLSDQLEIHQRSALHSLVRKKQSCCDGNGANREERPRWDVSPTPNTPTSPQLPPHSSSSSLKLSHLTLLTSPPNLPLALPPCKLSPLIGAPLCWGVRTAIISADFFTILKHAVKLL